MTKLNESQLPEVTLDRITAVETAVSRSDAYLISGGEVTWTGAGFIYRVGAAEYWLAGAKYTSVETQIELTQGNTVFDRIDLIVFSEQGTVLVIQGEASPTPFEPSYDASEFLKRSAVLVKAGRTFPEIVRSIIYAEGAANEWAVTATGEGFQLSDSSSPGAGNFAIAAVAVQTQNSLLFTADDALLVERWQELKLQIYPVAQWSTARRLRLTLRNSAGVRVGNSIAIRNGVFGFRSRIPSYQLLTIPLSAFGVVRGVLVGSLLLEVTGREGLPPISFFLDNLFVDTYTLPSGEVGEIDPTVLAEIQSDIENLKSENIGQSSQIAALSANSSSSLSFTQITDSVFSANINNRLLLNPSASQTILLPNSNLIIGDTIRFARFPGNTQEINLNLGGGRYNTLLPGDGNARLLIPSNFTIVDLIWLDNTIGWLASQPNIVVARSNSVNVLAYTALALESYTYFDSVYTITAINDANINAGVMKSSGGTLGTLKMRATFSVPVFLNEIRVRVGQFNGTFNAPDRMRVFRGNDDTGLLLFTDNDICIPANNSGAALQTKTIDLLNQSAFDIPSSTFTFVFDAIPSGNAVSIADLSLRGSIV